jgi:hypothetical protein
MHEVGRVEVAAPGARALAWVGGELFDAAGGVDAPSAGRVGV